MTEAEIDALPGWLEEIEGGIDAVAGIKSAGVHCGLKTSGLDLALFYCERPSIVAGTFTTNRFQAAPVRVSQQRLSKGIAQAIVANSGNANSCTGEAGLSDARRMAAYAAARLNLPEEHVLVASTGHIGIPLPMDKILRGIEQAAANLGKNGEAAAEAIRTTDTYRKTVAVRFEEDGRSVTIGGIAKGAGMICPKMATMLSFLFTDAHLPQARLQQCLSEAVDASFNSITVDGDNSTNDTVLLLANGLGGEIDKPESLSKFSHALRYVCTRLAKMIVADGEGATKFLEIKVTGAPNQEEARKAGMAVANSPLVKSSFFGEKAIWGRIAAALGASGVEHLEPRKTQISINGYLLMKDGGPADVDEKALAESLKNREIEISIDLGAGKGFWQVWTCDLTPDYVRLNIE